MYVGTDIGAANGELDDHKGYRALDAMACDDGGRHVMQIGARLINGVDGYTFAQYINSAYRVKGWANKAEMANCDNAGGGGTIRVMENRVIQPGEEILMAYHDSYWSRWGAEDRRRGRKRKVCEPRDVPAMSPRASTGNAELPSTPASRRRVSLEAAEGSRGGGSAGRMGGEGAVGSPTVGALQGDGGGYGQRVRDDAVARVPTTGGKKRGRPPKTCTQTETDRDTKKRHRQPNNKRLRWTVTNREEFDRKQKCARTSTKMVDVGVSRSVWQNVYGRGEGGGVT